MLSKILALLGVTLVGLKMMDLVDWSWSRVLSPFWGIIVLALLLEVVEEIRAAYRR